MRFRLLLIGETHPDYLQTGINLYEKRIQRYVKFEIEVIPDVRNAGNMKPDGLKAAEGALLLKRIRKNETLILLDERGKRMDSTELSGFLENQMIFGRKALTFMIGGAYGFSEEVYARTVHQISLSRMTFSHQLARLIFLEQLYRAFTIIKGEPYHHG